MGVGGGNGGEVLCRGTVGWVWVRRFRGLWGSLSSWEGGVKEKDDCNEMTALVSMRLERGPFCLYLIEVLKHPVQDITSLKHVHDDKRQHQAAAIAIEISIII